MFVYFTGLWSLSSEVMLQFLSLLDGENDDFIYATNHNAIGRIEFCGLQPNCHPTRAQARILWQSGRGCLEGVSEGGVGVLPPRRGEEF